ncbi:MAG: MaoC family dehydratase [Thermoanaerobaculaceae bacterium]|nr:MaoC family dehydratase [Thermoanaerobaculaceae bacterium]
MALKTIHVRDLPTLTGTAFASPRWIEVTQAQVDEFAHATGDHQWIHVDPERAARESPFHRTIAHGYLSLALVPPLLFEMLEVTGARLVINYGTNKVRFPAPVPVGSRVRLTGEVASVEPVEGGFQVLLKVAMEIEGNSKPAMAAEVIYRYLA